MKAYKLIKHANATLIGRIFTKCPVLNEWLLAATPTDPTMRFFYSDKSMLRILVEGNVEEVELQNVKWVHPHLLKSVRDEMNKA